MSEFSFRWLHFSDLHFGMKDQQPLWANLKHFLYDDLPRLFDQSGPWDLMIFSGDIVQKGDPEEFLGATEVLNELYSHLAKLNCNPRFIAVPGNHDLVRPDKDDMAVMLLQDWQKKVAVREKFLNDTSSQYRTTVTNSLANYQAWYEDLSNAGIPVLETKQGLLPGDQVRRIEIEEGKVGIVGLNSTWLQLSQDTKSGDLHVDHRQLSSMLPDAEGWCRQNHFNLLITHQPVDWLNDDNLATWKKEIAPPSRFDIHLFGHMHEPASDSRSTMGSSPITTFQSPSLFGLEYLADGTSERIHGYSAGELSVFEGKRQLRIWPRTYMVTNSGQAKMTPNSQFILTDNFCTETLLPAKTAAVLPGTTVKPCKNTLSSGQKLQIFKASEDNEPIKFLDRFRHYILPSGPHRLVRRVEQNTAKNALKKRCFWLVVDWGLSSDEFISSVLETCSISSRPLYRIDFGEIPSDASNLHQEIEVQIGLRIQQLSEELANAEEAILMFDDITLGERPPGVLPRELSLENLAETVLDYCPSLIIIMRTGTDPENKKFEKVHLGALDEADLQSYINSHPDGGQDLATPSVVGQLFNISAGVPERVDHALKSLKVVTLSELVASHEEGGNVVGHEGHQGLHRAIEKLGNTNDPSLLRAYQMLQALSTFPHGAQFEHIKRFNGVHGFYPDNATELRQRALITSSTLPGLTPQSLPETQRILSVPRTIRDVVRNKMSEGLLDRHNRRAAELYFGSNWRAGSTSWPPDRKYSSQKCSHYEIENASAILLRLFKAALHAEVEEEIVALMHLAAAYVDALHTGSHYYGAAEFASSFLHTAPSGVADKMIDRVRLVHGQSLRMISEKEKAIEILEGLDPSSLSRSDRESLLLDLALAYESYDNNKAVGFAKKLLDTTKSGSIKFQAQAIVLEAEPDGPKRRSKLIALESDARKNKYYVVANNLALTLSKESDDPEEINSYLTKVIDPVGESNNIYNMVRATLALAERCFNTDEILSNADHSRLITAYQYLFIQRIPSLFDRCHTALWKSFIQRGEILNLFALFRHSSFIWRIRGVVPTEKQCIASLSKIADQNTIAVPQNRDGSYFNARVLTAASKMDTNAR
ncbi:MAG: metallophosphoesterase [Hyphomicrobiales bacterium]